MMPSMMNVLYGFEETLGFTIVKKTVVDGGDVAESSKIVPATYFEGILQPLKQTDLMIKPEGERKWKWWSLFTDLDLEVDWIIRDENNVEYRVMATSDWRGANYQQYQLTEGPGVRD